MQAIIPTPDVPAFEAQEFEVGPRGDSRRLFENEFVQRPFDLEAGLMLRACIGHVSDVEHIVLAVMPHLVCDAWSSDVLCDELAVLLDAEAAVCLPALDVQYGDFVEWQRSWLGRTAREEIRQYYIDHLAGAKALHLPYDGCSTAADLDAGEHLFELPPSLSAGIRALGVSQRASPFMVLMAAYNVVLTRWSGQEDILVVSLFAGRSQPELLPLIGFFANFCPIRTDMSGNPPLLEILHRSRASILDATDRQQTPYGLFEELAAETGGGLPPFTANANWVVPDRAAGYGTRRGRMRTVERYDIDHQPYGSKYQIRSAINLWVTAASERRIAGRIVYRRALFEPATVERFVEDLKVVLETMVLSPHRRLHELLRRC
jgi:hypothetical protein